MFTHNGPNGAGLTVTGRILKSDSPGIRTRGPSMMSSIALFREWFPCGRLSTASAVSFRAQLNLLYRYACRIYRTEIYFMTYFYASISTTESRVL